MMQDKIQQDNDLLFDGSVWCNLDVALRSVDQALRRRIRPSELTVIEWYILRALYEEDGRHASELARAVGRAATSFTPNLDKLQSKDYIERRPDAADRRAVRIFLTQKGHDAREEVLENAVKVDREMRELFDAGEFAGFETVVRGLQILDNLG
ncbi:MAG: MarR family transcriptional regulator [Anaerolineaceae bacterium]|nr:MAG: MarR family transcriptional regulator [Anaerolineaceae bacterium]